MARLSLSAFLQAARLKATRDEVSLKSVVEDILFARFESSIRNGRTVIRTSEAGGSTDFTLPAGLTPTELIELANQALRWLQAQPDPENPRLPKAVRRLRVCFDRAAL